MSSRIERWFYDPNAVFYIKQNIIIMEGLSNFWAIVQNISVFFAAVSRGANSWRIELGLFSSHFDACHVI